MIEHLKQETFDILMEIFWVDGETSSPKIDEVNQHISRKECLYILRRDMRIKNNHELEEAESYPVALQEMLKMELVDTLDLLLENLKV